MTRCQQIFFVLRLGSIRRKDQHMSDMYVPFFHMTDAMTPDPRSNLCNKVKAFVCPFIQTQEEQRRDGSLERRYVVD